MSNLDYTDRQLLALWRKGARLLKVSRATVQNRISKLEREGIVLGYTAKLKKESEEDFS